MASATTTKALNLAQLDGELGGRGLVCSVGLPDVVTAGVSKVVSTVAASTTTQAQLDAGIAAHVPVPTLANKATIESRAQAALTANANFLAIGAPTQAQTLAQVQVLTKECSGLIRLALWLLDSTVGT